jgi:hypothetical protein
MKGVQKRYIRKFFLKISFLILEIIYKLDNFNKLYNVNFKGEIMSVFKVALNNVDQGKLDTNPASGLQLIPSVQRGMFVSGPNGVYRELIDGSTFTDCNYWKRFAYPQTSYENAIVEVLSDDGSIFSNDPSENTFPVVTNVTTVTTSIVEAINYLTLYNSFASFIQISNNGGEDVVCELNGLSSAQLTIPNGNTQTFNNGDLQITSLGFSAASSGSTSVQIIAGVKSLSYS